MTRSAPTIVLVAALVVALPARAADPAPVSGKVAVDGKPLALAHAYLFHAPDNWEETQKNSVAVLTEKPLDEKAMKGAKTLAEVLRLAERKVVVEVRPAGDRAELMICHPAFGDGLCYTTSLLVPEWQPAKAAPGHLAGALKTFTGGETTVFQKHKVFYDFRFDAAPVKEFDKRK